MKTTQRDHRTVNENEWTVESVRELASHHDGCKRIAEAHNAALAAAVDQWTRSRCFVTLEAYERLEQQLAAEREKHTPDKCRVCGMPELRCNHHRSPTNRPIYEQLREKVQTLVDALERITKSPFVVSEMVSVADDALAKVKEGEV